MKRLTLGVALTLMLVLLLAGCVRHRWLEVEPGGYAMVRGTDEASRAAARQVRSLHVDREAATATLTLDDGSQVTLAFVDRERSEWPEGCPTNIIQHHLEVLDVEKSELSIGPMTFQEPVLVRNCPRDPREIVLREDGPIGGGGTARSASCLVFGQGTSTVTEVATLGQWQGAGYTFLRGRDGSSLMFWYDASSAARCQTHTTSEDEVYRATCSAETAAGQRLEWEVTTGGQQAGVAINGQPYDLDRGRLFLITTRGDAIEVVQLDRDLSAVEPEEEDIIAFAESVPEILQLVRPASDPLGEPPSPLPHSEKGYELYSWTEQEDGPWHYTLLTGTDRLKTADEITSGEDIVSDAGWVKVTVTGEEALYDLLGRLPAGEQIFWRSEESLLPQEATTAQFRLPQKPVVVGVLERAQELDLRLAVDAAGATARPGQEEQPQAELEALLEMPQTLPDGARVPLSFTLLNRSEHALYVLKWYTPLEGIAGEIFHVRRDGRLLPYQGILAMRGDPGPQDYVQLAPGASAEATVDLAQAYDFSQAGTYTIRFISPRISHVAPTEAEFAETVDDLGPVPMPSNTVTVTVGTGE